MVSVPFLPEGVEETSGGMGPPARAALATERARSRNVDTRVLIPVIWLQYSRASLLEVT